MTPHEELAAILLRLKITANELDNFLQQLIEIDIQQIKQRDEIARKGKNKE